MRIPPRAVALFIVLATPTASAAQGRDLGACPAVTVALNPADPMHSEPANAPAARAALGQCGAPGSPSHQLSLSLIEATAGRHEAVLAAVAPVLTADPANRYALRFRCHAQASLGRAKEGLADCDRVVAQTPAWGPAHHSRGHALSLLRRYKEAVAALRRATELDPQYAHSWNNLGVWLSETGDDDGALKAYTEAVGRLADSLYVRNAARSLVRLKRYDQAALLLDSALVAFPGDALAWYERADLEWQRSRPSAARPFVERALQLTPRSASARMLRGRLRARDKDVEGAAADFRAAAAADTAWGAPPLELAALLGGAKRCAEARAPLVEAFVRAPRSNDPYYEWERCFGQTRAGLAVLDAALARVSSMRLHMARAEMPDSLRSAEQRLADWDAVLRITGDSLSGGLKARMGRARELVLLRRTAEAIAEFTAHDARYARVRRLHDERLVPLGMLALLKADQGDLAAASRHLAAFDSVNAAVKRVSDSTQIANKRMPEAMPLRLWSFAAYFGHPGPAPIGTKLLRQGDARGIDWLLRGLYDVAAADALAAAVRSGRLPVAGLMARVREGAGMPGQGRALQPDGSDRYVEYRYLDEDDDVGERIVHPYYPDAMQALAADRRRVAGEYFSHLYKALGYADRELGILAIELTQDLSFGASEQLTRLEAYETLRRILAADLGLGAGAHELCTADGRRQHRLVLTPEGLQVRWEYMSRAGWSGGGQGNRYNPRSGQLTLEVANLAVQLADTYRMDGVLARGGMLRGRASTLRLCR